MAVAECKVQVPVRPSPAFPHVLVATDFSEASRRALCEAVALAAGTQAQISLIHVVQTDRRYATLENPPEIDLQRIDAEERLRALVRDVAPGQNVNIILERHGPVADAVAAAVNESDIDLLVIGTRARGGLSKVALGSVAEELLRVVSCPVLTIGPRADIAAISHGPGFHRILFATDFGPGSMAALPLALALAKTHHARLILVHMVSPMRVPCASLSAYAPAGLAADEVEEWQAASRQRALQQLKECLSRETELEQEPKYVVGFDFPPEGILTAVDEFDVDLIVMGANRSSSPRVAAHSPRSAVHEIVQKAPCPVLTVTG